MCPQESNNGNPHGSRTAAGVRWSSRRPCRLALIPIARLLAMC